MEILKIGSTVYAVHNHYDHTDKPSGVIRVGRIKTYKEFEGDVIPVIKETGSKQEITGEHHKIYTELSDAIDAISNSKKSK